MASGAIRPLLPISPADQRDDHWRSVHLPGKSTLRWPLCTPLLRWVLSQASTTRTRAFRTRALFGTPVEGVGEDMAAQTDGRSMHACIVGIRLPRGQSAWVGLLDRRLFVEARRNETEWVRHNAYKRPHTERKENPTLCSPFKGRELSLLVLVPTPCEVQSQHKAFAHNDFSRHSGIIYIHG